MESVAKTLYQTSTQLQRVIGFYQSVQCQFDKPPEYNTVVSDNLPSAKQLSGILLASEREIHRILKLSKTLSQFEKPKSRSQAKVVFKEDGRTFLDFLSCFEFGGSGNLIDIKKDVTEEKKQTICKFIFHAQFPFGINQKLEKFLSYILHIISLQASYCTRVGSIRTIQ